MTQTDSPTDSAAQQIADEQDRRHNHYDERNVSRCRSCGSFVETGIPQNGQLRYRCTACQRWMLEYVGTKEASRS